MNTEVSTTKSNDSVLERKAILARRITAHRVVVPVVDIGDLKLEVRVARRDRPLTPLDSTPHDVDSFISALQPAGEADGDPAHSAADIEHVVVQDEDRPRPTKSSRNSFPAVRKSPLPTNPRRRGGVIGSRGVGGLRRGSRGPLPARKPSGAPGGCTRVRSAASARLPSADSSSAVSLELRIDRRQALPGNNCKSFCPRVLVLVCIEIEAGARLVRDARPTTKYVWRAVASDSELPASATVCSPAARSSSAATPLCSVTAKMGLRAARYS